MKRQVFHSLLALITISFFAACKDNPSSEQASVLPRGSQPQQLDRFEQEIQAFEKADQETMPPKDAVLFTGSSSIRLWSGLEKDFPSLPVINRGFGGSTIPEVIHYADRIVFKYEPQVIVLYCGENDIAEETPPAVVFQNFKKFAALIEKRLPNTSLIFISAKPSPQRWNLWKQFQQFNSMVQPFAESRPQIRFVDITQLLLAADGKPDPALFVEDKLHLNEKGYQRWVQALQPLLVEVYKEKTNQ